MAGNRITRIVAQKRNPDRVNIYLDGEFSFGLYRDTAAWLEVGQELSDCKIKKLLDEDLKNEVYIKALRYISYKQRTVLETRIKLQNEGYDEALIAETISRLSESGLLNDKSYAVQWVDERQSLKPRSRRALRQELQRKGIPENLIRSVVEDVDDFQSAYELAAGRIWKYEGLSEIDFKKKLGNYLAGRGYQYDVISEVIRKLWKRIQSSAN